MTFLLEFLAMYAEGLFRLGPVLLVLVGLIVALGLRIGRLERWSHLDALYFTFVTATTVGYGDLRPTHRRSKWLAIVIAINGLLLTGLLVSIGLTAVSHAFEKARHAAESFTQ